MLRLAAWDFKLSMSCWVTAKAAGLAAAIAKKTITKAITMAPRRLPRSCERTLFHIIASPHGFWSSYPFPVNGDSIAHSDNDCKKKSKVLKNCNNRFHFSRKSTPKVPGPQYETTVQPSRVNRTSLTSGTAARTTSSRCFVNSGPGSTDVVMKI